MSESFVRYNVTGYTKRDDGDDGYPVEVSGVIPDEPNKLTSIFRRHPELLPCNVITRERYTEVTLGGKRYGTD